MVFAMAAEIIEKVDQDTLRQGLLDAPTGWINILPDQIPDCTS